MDIKALIQKAVEYGQQALSEHDSKKVLASYNIPVTKEALVQTKDEAAQNAAEIGFPVVLKACSHEVMHKSEGGLVAVSLNSQEDVKAAFSDITKKAGPDIDGILVQEMVSGQRELMLGLLRDPQFGPCVMAGFGGIMTEVINDTCFRMAPIDNIEADDMLDELRAKAMLEAFRGQKPADRKAISDTLVALGKIGMENDPIAEIDINPMIIDSNGAVIAVDALIVLKGGQINDNNN